MELSILTSVLLLGTASIVVTKFFTRLINGLEANKESKQVKVSIKTTAKAVISVALFFMLSVNTASAQDCPTAYSSNGGRLKLDWSGATKPAGITTVNWTDGVDYAGSDVNTSSWRTTSTAVSPTGTESGTLSITYSGGTYNCNISGGALPIELMYFKGEVVNGATELTWATASEQNNSHFTIERSSDNQNWDIVTTVDGAGTSNTIIKYETTDYTPVNGIVYYRLRQDDYNGDYTYSNTIAIKNTNVNKLEIMGMYVENNTLRVSFNGEAQTNVEIQIVSLLGSVQSVQTVNPSQFNGNQVELDISNLKGGVYNITVKSGNDVTSGKFIK